MRPLPPCLLLDAGPVRGAPRGDRPRVALAGDALGLLGGAATALQPGAEGAGVEPDAALLLDQWGQPGGGPQLGREPVRRGAAAQPPQDDLLLGEGEFARPARYGAGPQALRASVPERGEPPPYRPGRDAEELGDFVGRVPFEGSLDGELTAMLQLVGGAFGSHPPSVRQADAH